jgi:hypothetical protein
MAFTEMVCTYVGNRLGGLYQNGFTGEVEAGEAKKLASPASSSFLLRLTKHSFRL